MSIAEAGAKTHVPEEVLTAALGLTPDQRESLALDLILSLEVREERDSDYEQAWGMELDRRMQSVLDGTANTIPWDDVKVGLFKPPTEARS